eukprot:CAMPEP_0119305280 /NCGR_PEP_ID=MMETSP1333-20130426/6314_1 /TAXON_ID=418940 /ORGANISM="Scyphosphaera apsteinii, Strain RCC1455" /LENGTH=442 /DNA_ID=CAMNT_0007308339 /DNA_START=137 /DNA_END=1465 /DNA_ORIENTATION=+
MGVRQPKRLSERSQQPPSEERHLYFDRVEVVVSGGHGGNGAVIHVGRNRKEPRLGRTAGGDFQLPPGGGRGGDVILFVDPTLPDLLHLHGRPQLKAECGKDSPGMAHLNAARRQERELAASREEANAAATGNTYFNMLADGRSLRIPVPAGTFVRTSGGRVLGDLVTAGQELTVAIGGEGGPCVLSEKRIIGRRGTRANRQSKARGDMDVAEIKSTDEELKLLTRGTAASTAIKLQLLLRTVADVGFVGLPNAGKSTLLGALTRASPEVAPYPFTTLMPNLGAMQARSADGVTSQAVLADLPGLVEGAHQGRGLGRQFLQQLRRVRLVLYVLDTSDAELSPAAQYLTLRRELQLYNPQYLGRPHIVVLNKLDLIVEKEGQLAFQGIAMRMRTELLTASSNNSDATDPVAVLPISGLRGKGLGNLKDAINKVLTFQAEQEAGS